MRPRQELLKRKQHRLPPAIYSTTEYAYYFTVCSQHNTKPFQNRTLADVVIESLLWTKQKHQWLLFCYCLMPDHLHFVCRLTDSEIKQINNGARGIQAEGVLDYLARFKSYTTNQAWKIGCN
jgi:REP element-mobilizing transposase RayT